MRYVLWALAILFAGIGLIKEVVGWWRKPTTSPSPAGGSSSTFDWDLIDSPLGRVIGRWTGDPDLTQVIIWGGIAFFLVILIGWVVGLFRNRGTTTAKTGPSSFGAFLGAMLALVFLGAVGVVVWQKVESLPDSNSMTTIRFVRVFHGSVAEGYGKADDSFFVKMPRHHDPGMGYTPCPTLTSPNIPVMFEIVGGDQTGQNVIRLTRESQAAIWSLRGRGAIKVVFTLTESKFDSVGTPCKFLRRP